MSITKDFYIGTSGVFTSNEHEHICSGVDRVLIVSVAFVPDSQQSLTGVRYAGESMTFIAAAQQGDEIRQELWYMTAPSTGQNAVGIDFSAEASAIVTSSSYNGIAQSGTIYNTRTGTGKRVLSIPVNSFSKSGCLAIGAGVADSEDAYVGTLFGSQEMAWDVAGIGLGIRSQGISAIGNFDTDEIVVPNSLTEASDWAIAIVGINAA